MSFTINETVSKIRPKDEIKVEVGRVSGKLGMFTGISGEYWISMIPSLNITGYGETEEESKSDLTYNLEVFCLDLLGLSKDLQQRELRKLGWELNKFLQKRYSSSFVDRDGVLQNFDFPEDVKTRLLEAA